MSTDYSEDTLVEQPAVALFSELGYDAANCFYENVGTSDSTLGRETTDEVVLVPKLCSALVKASMSNAPAIAEICAWVVTGNSGK